MIPMSFDYYRASSVEEALSLLQAHEGAKLLAGGHSLLPLLKLRLSAVPALIDIGRLEALKGVKKDDEVVRIGALTTYSALEASRELPPALKDAVYVIGDPAIRNRGTIGGSLAHADPAADLPPVMLVLGATLQLQGPEGTRAVSAESFFTGIFETGLGEQELITAIDLPTGGHSSAYVKLADPASRYALVGCAVNLENGEPRVALCGMLPYARRLSAVEAALKNGLMNEDTISRAAQAVREDVNLDEVMGDISGSADYRLGIAPEIIKRALLKAASRAAKEG